MGCPVVAILGNHDYASRQIGRVIEGLNATTAKLLVNETLEVGGVTLAGLDDGIHGAPRFDFFGKDRVSKSLLALFHEGDRVEEMPGHVSLQLSGHSHGGQVCYPNGRPVMPAPLGEKYVAGFFADTAAPLFVSKGVGTSGPDFRLFCAPEVNVLTLRSAS